ncbi:MAG: class I SAM-dependent methyltransferase [Planctomycetales bacterium]|nr:class I SAM-dependent methyltransferase [Planctomycetales bacterium]
MNLIHLAERGLVPDSLIRVGIRRLLAKRLREIENTDISDFVRMISASPLAVATDSANQQHYEVPAAFFESVLGPRLKYSCGLFHERNTTLAESEEAMLQLTCERAEIEDGMRVLELGCGWGSLTLWLAEHYPNCQITAVSNSASQRRYIEDRAANSQLQNVTVVTADMRDFSTTATFDRIISVEMFEHLRNYQDVFRRVAPWLSADGKLFAHIFCHRSTPYLFESDGTANWMGRHFFTGGMMPSEHLFAHFDAHLGIDKQWRVSGMHYWRTCEQWLANADRNRQQILTCFQRDLTPSEARITLQRWRIFFLACAELFRYNGGAEWFVAHYLFDVVGPRERANSKRVDLCGT